MDENDGIGSLANRREMDPARIGFLDNELRRLLPLASETNRSLFLGNTEGSAAIESGTDKDDRQADHYYSS